MAAVGIFLVPALLEAADGFETIRTRQHNPLPTGQHLMTVTSGPAGFVAGGENGLILRSVHGASWEPVETPVFDTFSNSFFTGGEYTLAGTYRILTSPDGLRWEDRTPPFLGVGMDLIYDLDRTGDRWAAVTPNAVFYSNDGLVWDRLAFQTYRNTHSIALGTDRLIVGLNNSAVLVRRPGVDTEWLEVSLGQFGASPVAVAFGEGVFKARMNGFILTSTDGVTWEAETLEGPVRARPLTHTDSGWICLNSGGTVSYSTDGANWLNIEPIVGPDGCQSVARSSNGTWVGVGGYGLIVTSIDGINWTRRDNGAGPALYGMVRFNGRWIAGGADGGIVTSLDGIHWDTRQIGVAGDHFRPYRVDDRVYLLGAGYCGETLCTDALYVTTNGVDWTRTDVLPLELRPVTTLPAPFQASEPPVRIGDHWLVRATVGLTGTGAIFASADGVGWDLVLLNGLLLTSLGGTDGLFLAGDSQGTVHRSTDLKNWESVRVTEGASITSLLAADGLILASTAGYGVSGVFASKEGLIWERLTGTRALLYGGSRIDDSFWFVGEGGTIVEVDTHLPSPLANLSVRAAQSEEAPPVIAGFVVEGSEPREVLIRAIGPGLTSFGVEAVAALPHLTLHSSEKRIAEAGAWTAQANADRIEETAARVGAFPLDRSRDDAALLLTLEPGVYTAVATGLDSGSSQPMVEVYDASGADALQSALVNSSNRGRLEVGGTLMGGFVVRGDRDRRILLRAVGPGLAAFGVADPAGNPCLKVWRDGEVIAANDEWSDGADPLETADAAVSAGAFALDPHSGDAALVIQAAPGNYTVHVTAAAGSIGGEILLEIYHLER